MKYIFSFILSLLMIGFPATISGQLLKIVVKDRALEENAMLMSPTGLKMLQFDDNGVYLYENADFKGVLTSSIMLGSSGTWFAILEEGQTLTVTCSLLDGRVQVVFEGKNAAETLFNNEYRRFAIVEDVADMETRLMTLEQRYNSLVSYINKNKDERSKQRLLCDLDDQYLQTCINMRVSYCQNKGIALESDASLQSLLSQINVNDPKDKHAGLSKFYIDLMTPIKPGRGTDYTDYFIAYLRTIDKYVTNPEVNYQKKDFTVLNAVGNSQPVDFDRFWPVVKEMCDSSIVNRYQYIIDTHGKNYEGTACPDFELADIKGNIHHLSEYRGKYVFIDIWATWCGPCCREIPYVAEHVKHYKDDNRIQFISISCDDTETPWLRKLEQDMPDWPQYYTNKSRYQKISHHFGIKSIPRFLLIGPDGTVITTEAPRPSHDDFYEQLENLM